MSNYAVEENGCWSATIKTPPTTLRRRLYEKRYGVALFKSLRVTCGNDECVNPEHAQPASRSELNATTRSSLKPEDVRAIHDSDEPNSELAFRHGVRPNHVRRIKAEKTWHHLWAQQP